MNIYDFTVLDRKGNPVSLRKYEGKVLLIVNTATACGFTPQYDDLDALYDAYRDKGFEILDFPCNQFGEQAQGSDDEIHQFCQLRYGTKFPRFKKINVLGDLASPLFTFLQSQRGFAGFDPEHPITPILHKALSENDPNYADSSSIKWNFTKFLVDAKGNVVQRFEPTATAVTMQPCIEALLGNTSAALLGKIDKFLSEAGVFFFATTDGQQAKVRPLGFHLCTDNKLVIGVGSHKDVYRQLMANPRIELVALAKDYRWLRVTATVVEENAADSARYEEMALEAIPALRATYNADTDMHMGMFHLENVSAAVVDANGVRSDL